MKKSLTVEEIFDEHLQVERMKGMHNVGSDFKQGFKACKTAVMQIIHFQSKNLRKGFFSVECSEWISEIETEIESIKAKKRALEIQANKLASAGQVKQADWIEQTEIRTLLFKLTSKQNLIKEIMERQQI